MTENELSEEQIRALIDDFIYKKGVLKLPKLSEEECKVLRTMIEESDTIPQIPPLWTYPDTLETLVIGPDTGKGVDIKKFYEEMWKELGEYEKREKK